MKMTATRSWFCAAIAVAGMATPEQAEQVVRGMRVVLEYSAVTGTIEVADEYQMPRMMGWTAGVFVFAADYLNSTKTGGETKP